MPGASELLGYAASALVAASMMMSNVVRLRLLNLLGAAAFAGYGAWIGAAPIVALNAFIVLVNLYFLARLRFDRATFELIEIRDPAAPWPNQFARYYAADIALLWPGFDLAAVPAPVIVMIRRNMLAVGMFVYHRTPEGDLQIDLDYVAPDYRDLAPARYFYGAGQRHCPAGDCGRWVVTSANPSVQRYLRRVGFVLEQRSGPALDPPSSAAQAGRGRALSFSRPL